MIHDLELAPGKLFIFHVICMTWNDIETRRSDLVEQLYSTLSEDQKQQIAEVEIKFIEKVGTTWEPNKIACYAFFEPYSFISPLLEQSMSEWSELIVDSNAFNIWMVSMQRWKSSINEEQLKEDERILFNYLSSVITAFTLLPLSLMDNVTNRLIRWFQDGNNEYIEFQQPIPVYALSFTPQQHHDWLTSTHRILLNHHKDMNVESRLLK